MQTSTERAGELMARAKLVSLYSHTESEECVDQLLELEGDIKDDQLREEVRIRHHV